MAMKGYSTLLKSLKLTAYHQMQLSIIPLFGGEGISALQGIPSAYTKPYRQAVNQIGF